MLAPPPAEKCSNNKLARRAQRMAIQPFSPADMPGQNPSRLSSSNSISSTSNFSSYDADSDPDGVLQLQYLPLVRRRAETKSFSLMSMTTSILRSLFPSLMNASLFGSMCRWPNLSAVMTPRISSGTGGRVVTGTFFGHKKGRISFAVQREPGSEPLLLVELATPTYHLVKEMASGMVRILLECDQVALQKNQKGDKKQWRPLWEEPVWTMYCNGQRQGFAVSRKCTAFDLHVLNTVKTVSVGAGVLPAATALTALLPSSPGYLEVRDSGLSSGKKDGSFMLQAGGRAANSEVMYMRAKFERVVGSKDSEAFYMLNPDSGRKGLKSSDFNNGGPELSVFLLRI